MKQKETLLTTPLSEQKIELSHLIIEEMGDEHKASSVDTPMRADAFDKTDDEKIALIEPHFRAIMETIGMDLSDDSLRGTPLRVAKMYVKELFQGLNPANMPSMTLFENKFQYNEMLVEKNINFYTNCEHHFVPFFGKAHVAYISSGKVIGLGKGMSGIDGSYVRFNKEEWKEQRRLDAELKANSTLPLLSKAINPPSPPSLTNLFCTTIEQASCKERPLYSIKQDKS
jgi:hypothetical protein